MLFSMFFCLYHVQNFDLYLLCKSTVFLFIYCYFSHRNRTLLLFCKNRKKNKMNGQCNSKDFSNFVDGLFLYLSVCLLSLQKTD